MERLESRSMLAADGNDTRSGAINLGSFDGAVSSVDRTGSVGTSGDVQDYYRFTLTRSNRLQVGLSGLSGNLNFELQNSSGARFGSVQDNSGTTSEYNAYALESGTYYLRIFKGSSSVFSNYALALDFGDDIRSTARSLGSFNGSTQSVTKTGHIGGNDNTDYFKFTLTNSNRAVIQLSGLSANLNLAIQDSTGVVLANRLTAGTASETVSGPFAPGTYYVRIYKGVSSASTNYTLKIAFGDDSRAAAHLLGTLSAGTTIRTGHVGGSDPADYYKFSISGSQKNAQIRLEGLSADLDIQLLNASGLVITSSTRDGSANEFINRNLGSGTYYLRVFRYTSSISSSYSLRIAIANFV